MMGDQAGLDLETIAGMAYDPLTGVWRMSDNTGVNYIAYFQKSGLISPPPPQAGASAAEAATAEAAAAAEGLDAAEAATAAAAAAAAAK